MRIASCSLSLALTVSIVTAGGAHAQATTPSGYACEDDLIEIMFAPASRVLLRDGVPVDLNGAATVDVEQLLQDVSWHEWHRIADVSPERLDELRAKGEARTGESLYDLNNIYRLRVPKDSDVWVLSRNLEKLPGVHLARPVPRPSPHQVRQTSNLNRNTCRRRPWRRPESTRSTRGPFRGVTARA